MKYGVGDIVKYKRQVIGRNGESPKIVDLAIGAIRSIVTEETLDGTKVWYNIYSESVSEEDIMTKLMEEK